jgi:ABC-type spermidine/putrescine transport system permease subunit I
MLATEATIPTRDKPTMLPYSVTTIIAGFAFLFGIAFGMFLAASEIGK